MERGPAGPLRTPETFHRNLSVTLTSTSENKTTDIYYGSGGGSNPMRAEKIVDDDFTPGQYLFVIRQPDIGLDYRQVCALRVG